MFRDKILTLLENKIFENFILVLICLNICFFILDSMIGFHEFFGKFVKDFEFITIIFFTIEYILRLLVIKKFSQILKPMMIIDLLAIVPYYMSFCTLNTVFLRILRFSKFIRVLKIGRYSKALDNIIIAFKSKKEELTIAFFVLFIGVFLSAILMYLAECEIQPNNFSSIPKSFYFSIITFTTIGYGDITPVTGLGKIIACISAIFGVGLHGLFIGIISSAFIEAFKRKGA